MGVMWEWLSIIHNEFINNLLDNKWIFYTRDK